MNQTLSQKNSRQENLFSLVDYLITLEIKRGIQFNEFGLPVFKDCMFLKERPRSILPYDHRLDAIDPKTNILCFFQKDQCLYRRLTLKKLERTAIEVAKYQGFCGFDLSIFNDMLKPFQDFYVLANTVIDIFFCLHGAKLIPNLRSDEEKGRTYFSLYETAPIVCCGTLGCSRRKSAREENKKEIFKYAITHPDQIVIQYGNNLCDLPNTKFIKAYGRRKKYE